MFLTRLVYTSKISDVFESSDIENILVTARRENERNNITGMLCFNRKYFLQCLEGSREDVNQTYHRILNDPRHINVIILDYKEVVCREFEGWSMGYVPESSLTAPTNLKYSGTKVFDPYDMSGESTYQMMLALRQSIPVA
ncbi:MAG: blue light sensor protein [Colwelliaceae bacterium]|nr:blue light sensor protein [Colwelliaceae bacterium]